MKKETKISIILVLLCVTFFIRCSQNDQASVNSVAKVVKDEAESTTPQVEECKYFLDSTTVSMDDYTLNVTSIFIKDSVSENEPNMFNPIFFNQILIVKKGGKKLYSAPHHVNYIVQKNASGKSILMMENVIIKVGILKGSKGYLFSIDGYGGCNSCSEYRAFYNDEGKQLYCRYATKELSYNNIGNLEQLLKEYGVKNNKEGNFSKVKVHF